MSPFQLMKSPTQHHIPVFNLNVASISAKCEQYQE